MIKLSFIYVYDLNNYIFYQDKLGSLYSFLFCRFSL